VIYAHGRRYLHAIGNRGAPIPRLPPTAEVLGIPLAVSDYDHVLDWMEATIAADARAYMTAAAVNLVMSAREDSETRAAVLGATLAVPDGQPLVWALHALGHRAATRVYGPDLMAAFCARAAAGRAALPVYLYGGRSAQALTILERRLRDRFPGLRIAGGQSPPFRALTAAEEERVVEEINSSGAAVVWVGTGQPKQERWMARMRARLSPPLLAGVGAAFDFHAGLVPQAPPWMQRAGLEWSYRLAREPRRLWRRYARYNPRFIAAFGAQYLRQRMHEAPWLMIPCVRGRLREGASTAEQAGHWGSIVPAFWSFLLAARARGLGTSYTTLHLVFEREVAEILGIPYDEYTQAGLTPVAYYTGEGFRPGERLPLDSITHWNGW